MAKAKKPLDWHGCYDESWKGLIVDEAFAHPAKAARGLIRRIFEHMQAQGWLPPHSRVVDVFGGIGTTAIQGASLGHEVVCVELEERFVKLARENFALHRLTWETMGDPLPVIIHGDSRKAAELVRGHFGACVGSPPYDQSNQDYAEGFKYIDKEKMVGLSTGSKMLSAHYGQSPGQLGAMPAGDVDAAIGSPPYMKDALGHAGGEGPRTTNAAHSKKGTPNSQSYGTTEGQLGSLKEGDFDAAVGSPPYEESMNTTENHDKRAERTGGFTQGMHDTKYGQNPFTFLSKDPTGLSNDARKALAATNPQVGALNGETFWSAAREILLQVHQLLRPNGYAAWIVKDYVKAGKRVPFCDNWAKLCEACGFEVVQRARCWLVKETTNPGLFGDVTKKTERKSFFRRLHERKPGAVRIDWEEVVFARKKQ